MSDEYIKTLLKKYNLRPNFTYGQNFLVDDIVLQDIVDAAEITSDDAVLEIGPGLGTLTEQLLGKARFVLSVEKDEKFLPVLYRLKKNHKNFRYEIADALEFNFHKFFLDEGFSSYKVVANIPYYITGKILQMFMTAKFKPESVTVLTQKEVARNVVAEAGDLSILAISVQLYGDPKIVRTVPARSFYPAPKVDSAVVRIDLHDKPKYEIADEKRFFKIVKACFSGKRKQIHNTLVNNLHVKKEDALKILSDLKINSAARPQELTIQNWVELSKKLLE